VRLAAQRFAGIDEVVDAALPNGQIFAVDLVDAMRNPVDDQRLRAGKGLEILKFLV
jgi:predicted metal-dependent hydrolase